MIRKIINHFIKTKKHSHSFSYSDFGSSSFRSDDKANISSYQRNVIVYRCVNLIAEAASHVPWRAFVKSGTKFIQQESHKSLELLRTPNMNQSGADFFSQLISDKLLFGNVYILISKTRDEKIELYLLKPSDMSILVENGIKNGYQYINGNNNRIFKINLSTGYSNILHIKSYNPKDDLYGLSCLEAASLPIKLHDYSTEWNNSLLKNGARPSGAIIVKDKDNYLTDEQFNRLKEQLYDNYSGSSNSGKPLLLEGSLDWKEMSISPKDMDFIESRNNASREIALAFGVPPHLLGISGDNTYSNMQEARLALWEETLIPLLDKISDSLSTWFSHIFCQNILIDFDRDSISALTEKRQNLWSKISEANFMTINEKRHLVGLKPIEGHDVIN
jgi:HK97 family phage portal protein